MQTQEKILQEIIELRHENARLKADLANLQRMLFGSKRERYIPIDNGQQSLFEENKTKDKAEEDVQETETTTIIRKKVQTGKAKRLVLPTHLPRVESIIEPEGLATENCQKIGEKVSEVLMYKPGKLFVERIIRPVYKLVNSNINPELKTDEAGEANIIVAPLPTQVIPNGNAGASLLSYLLVSKFIDHLPFYRQVQMFKREGMTIPESTITGWFRKSCELLEPLYEHLCEQIKGTDYVQADESPISVLSANKPGSTHKGYQWVFLLPKSKLVIFKYHQSRAKEVPMDFLNDFSGCLQTDGYAGYNALARRKGITHIVCMAHARRKFEVALQNDEKLASYAMDSIQKLYAIERSAMENNLDSSEIVTLRKKESVPLLKELKQWLDQEYIGLAPKSSLGNAIAYSLKFWSELTRYVDNGEWSIDNNAVENKIRPLALGRKNYLFAGSHQAAQQAAMMYSFFGTCKLNGIEPLEWLSNTLQKLPDTKLSQLPELLPRR